MVGRTVDQMFPRVEHTMRTPLLELDGLAGQRLPRKASFQLHRGEILGIAGLVGAGRTEMLRAIFGLEPVTAGVVRVVGIGEVTGWQPVRAVRCGFGLQSVQPL